MDSILNAYKFFKKSTDEENPDHDLFEEVFTEVQSRLPGNLAEEDLQTLKDELPVEIIVKYAQCLLNHSNQASKKQPGSAESKSSEDKSLSTALDVLNFCEEFDPAEYHDAFIDMIDLYFEFGYLEKSTQLCERLYTASNETDRQEILLRLGFLFGKLGDSKKEMEAYERVLKFNPENKKARFRLSEIYETNGFYQDALKVLKQPTLVKEGGALPSKKHDQKREIANKNPNLPDLMLQKHQSEITFGGGDMLESDDDRQDSSSSHPSLGKRVSGISQDYDQLGRENNQNPSKKNLKVEGLIKDINNENEFNSKTRRRMVNIVELNEQFFINIQTNIEEMLSQFDLERLLLDFKQSELGLKSGTGQPHDISEWDPKLYSSIDFRSIKKALKLELKKDSFKENIYQLLLNESKGRIRSTFQGAQLDAPEDFKKDLNTLFIFKRKKQTTNPENSRIESWLKESKNKSRVARNLAQKLISKMKTVPDFIGFGKFVDIVDSSIKVLYQQKKYVLLSQICEVLYKISKVFVAYPDFQVTFYNFGFLANCRIQNFEKAYIFFRVIGKNLIQEEPVIDQNGMNEEKTPEKVAELSENPLARLMQIAEANTKTHGTMEMALSASKPGLTSQVRLLDLNLSANLLKPELQIQPPNKVQEEKEVPPSRLRESFMKLYSAYSQSTLNLVCFTMINHLFNEFSSVGPTTNSNSSNTNSGAYHHRLFFQKFQKQFESGKQLKFFVNLISANNYIGSGSTGPAKECLLANGDLETSPLTNFLLGFIVLTESTNRNKENKIESVHEAFEYFERYKELSPASKLPEVYYNLGRALSHLNMPDAAMRMFAKNRTLVSERLAESRRLLEAAARQLNKEVDWARFEAHSHQVKLQHLYYEAAFNQLVWKQKLHRDGLAFENLRSIFYD